jgi:hypothetical protein
MAEDQNGRQQKKETFHWNLQGNFEDLPVIMRRSWAAVQAETGFILPEALAEAAHAF